MQCTIDSYSAKGSTRAGNEDAVVHSEAQGVALLADGMGGHNAGEIASGLTVEAVYKSIDGYLNSHPGLPTLDAARELLKNAITEQNLALLEKARSIPAYEGMGCTLVVVWLLQAQALIANVGDSRCYHLRDSALSQVTRDHSFVQFQLDNGLISEADARGSQGKNYLLRSVGTASKVSADFFVVDLQPGDVLLAVSDGMTEALSHEALQDKVAEAMKFPQPARRLVNAAIEAGSRDNVSVQFIHVARNDTGSAPGGSAAW